MPDGLRRNKSSQCMFKKMLKITSMRTVVHLWCMPKALLFVDLFLFCPVRYVDPSVSMCMYKSPHSLAWPGWLCGYEQIEKRSWLALRWQTALRTLAGLAGYPTGPVVNLCFILWLLKSYIDTVQASAQIVLHPQSFSCCAIYPVSVSSKRMLIVNFQILLYQFRTPIPILTDRARTPWPLTCQILSSLQ